jgi:hypothetical protein
MERSSSRWRPCARGRRRLSSLAWAPPVGDGTEMVHGLDSGRLGTGPSWWAAQIGNFFPYFFLLIPFVFIYLFYVLNSNSNLLFCFAGNLYLGIFTKYN